jgi:hypothetical protein
VNRPSDALGFFRRGFSAGLPAAAAALLLVTILAGGVLVGPQRAAAQDATVAPRGGASSRESQDLAGSRDGVDLSMVDFIGAVSPEGVFRMRLRITNRTRRTLDDLRVVASVHRRAFHRLDFARAVDEGRVGELWGSLTADIDALEGRRVTTVELRRTAAELGWGGDDDNQGVYPLVVRLLRGERTVETMRTAVVVVSSTVAQPVRAALVAPVDAPPAIGPGDTAEPGGLLRDLAPGGRLPGLLADLGRRPDVPVTFALDARLLDDAQDLADGYTVVRRGERIAQPPTSSLAGAAGGFVNQLRRTMAQPQIEAVALPYGPADLSALVRGGMAQEAGRLVRARVEALTGKRPSRALLPADGLSRTALTEAARAGVDTVVLQEEYLDSPPRGSGSPAPVRRLRTSAGRTLRLAVPDPFLGEVLADGAALRRLDPPVAVQRVIAETASLYFERPFAEDPRGVVLLPPLEWDPPAGFAAGLAGALRAAPWIEPVTLSTLLREVDPPDREPDRLRYPDGARRRELPSWYVRELRGARTALGSLAGVLATDATTPTRFDRELLSAGSVWYREQTADGVPLIRDVMRTVNRLYDAVRVSSSPTVVLSGVDGQIPVTVENSSPLPLRLAVRMESQRFRFAGGPERTVVVPAGGTQTVVFRGRTRTPGGTFPVRVVVEDPDGQLRLASGTLVVRSTAVSIAALAVVIGAGMFLLLWWLRTFARRRRQARHGEAA